MTKANYRGIENKGKSMKQAQLVCKFQTQEREAKDVMKRKARELQQQRKEAMRRGGGGSYGSGGYSSSMRSMGSSDSTVIETSLAPELTKPSRQPSLVPISTQ